MSENSLGLGGFMFTPSLKEKFKRLGFDLESTGQRCSFYKHYNDSEPLTEVDILFYTEDSAIVVEVKDDFKKKDLTEHLDRMKKLKTLPRFANKKLYGAIAAYFDSAKRKSKQQVFEQGFYVIDNPYSIDLQIEPFPKGCKPKAW
jgi:hypothetical protein